MNEQTRSALHKIHTEANRIVSEFFTAGARKELNIAFSIKRSIMEEITIKNNYHPSVFQRAMDKTFELMRLSSFPHFVRYAQENRRKRVVESIASDETKNIQQLKEYTKSSQSELIQLPTPSRNPTSPLTPFSSSPGLNRNVAALLLANSSAKKLTLQALLRGETKMPYSLGEFENFLKTVEHSEENLEFLRIMEQYKKLVQKIAPICTESFLTPNALNEMINNIDNTPPGIRPAIVELTALAQSILVNYFTPGGPKELNIAFNIKQGILNGVQVKRNYHPDVFKVAIDKTLELMRLSSFPHFIRYVDQGSRGRGGSDSRLNLSVDTMPSYEEKGPEFGQ
ncbi:hypothetical protein BKA69DRAFT_817494 [Paraphysoderma sedebokerense]|nr:hypothetical protein BKA69DRAFT_816526 [Paraphysoderma sedebokerense]KAI9138201.1 hypothetical protein BKA69DRAFT_817494 [Paraphysoderma sedebokerense]